MVYIALHGSFAHVLKDFEKLLSGLLQVLEILAIDPGSGPQKALVIRRNGEAIAFAVDKMLGRQEVVVRPIDDPLARAPGIAGATDLGDGRPTLVLDLVELGARIASRERRV